MNAILCGADELKRVLAQEEVESIRECRKLLPLLNAPKGLYFDNVDTRFLILHTGRNAMPVTVNRAEYENSYVVSPYTHFVSYALDELRLLSSPVLRSACAVAIHVLGRLLKWGSINNVVQVNNFALSTNLYPSLESGEIEETKRQLVEKFPDAAIVFRSISTALGVELLDRFVGCGFRPVPNRLVYLQDPTSKETLQSHSFKKDLRLLRRSPYTLSEATSLDAAEAARARELYELLYVGKYSECNPRVTAAYLQWAVESKFLKLYLLRDGDRIDGMFATFRRGKVVTTPFMGYDTSLPQDRGLYRILTAHITLEAARAGLLVHASAGVGHFKRARGGMPHVEYSLVFAEHLPLRRRLVWRGLAWLARGLGQTLMKKYG